MENSLIEDGSVPTLDAACGPCRFTQIDLDSGIASRQIAHVLDAIPLRPAVPGGFADNDVSDVLALNALTPSNHRSASKTLVADFATLGLSRLDNSEGTCWGPSLANGHRTLVVVSDDNFNPLQITQFAAFKPIDRP